mmetsp:Transcript_13090/g.31269  ORF Transcript_13090/g.31269 Transcript_13090/m.31269 type:complete len:196 (-) Transcript_13090:794-1381(-)
MWSVDNLSTTKPNQNPSTCLSTISPAQHGRLHTYYPPTHTHTQTRTHDKLRHTNHLPGYSPHPHEPTREHASHHRMTAAYLPTCGRQEDRECETNEKGVTTFVHALSVITHMKSLSWFVSNVPMSSDRVDLSRGHCLLHHRLTPETATKSTPTHSLANTHTQQVQRKDKWLRCPPITRRCPGTSASDKEREALKM